MRPQTGRELGGLVNKLTFSPLSGRKSEFSIDRPIDWLVGTKGIFWVDNWLWKRIFSFFRGKRWVYVCVHGFGNGGIVHLIGFMPYLLFTFRELCYD